MLNSFTYEEYKYILTELKTKYTIVDFRGAWFRASKYEDSYAVVRHDVDLDLSLALRLAEMENDLEVKATYFVLVSSDAYNIFSKDTKIYLDKIVSLGHDIGLHYNPLCYDVPAELDSLNKEVFILESALGTSISTISWHKPASLGVAKGLKSGYFDTTQPPFFNAQMKYFADSRGRWRYGHPLESPEFKAGYPLHICFHPIWWDNISLPPSQKLNNFICNHNEDFRHYITEEIAPEDESYIFK